jgi:hypothetical protein
MKSFNNVAVCWILSLDSHRWSLSQNGPLYQVLPIEHYAFSTTILELAWVGYSLFFVCTLCAAMPFDKFFVRYTDSGTHPSSCEQAHVIITGNARPSSTTQQHFVVCFCVKLMELITSLLRFPKSTLCSTLEL